MAATVQALEDHVRLTGILSVALGAFAAIGAVLLLVLAGVVWFPAGDPTDAAGPALVAGLAFLGLLLLSIWAIAVGAGLLSSQPWVRPLALGLAVVSLVLVPFGTLYGVYALWVLTRKGVDDVLAGTVFWRPEQRAG